MKITVPGARLASAVKYVRQDAVFADIGTDHAYLPIYLLRKGIVKHAVLSDINEGPLHSARANAEQAGVLDRVEIVLADGAMALCDKGITDVAIFGMGGELIADIIERAPFLSDRGVRLILQPMTKQTYLCKYLEKKGFELIGETYTTDSGKFYRTLCVTMGERTQAFSENFAEIGFEATPCEEFEAKLGYLQARYASVIKAVNGKKAAGYDFDEDERSAKIILAEILRIENLLNGNSVKAV